MRPSTQREELDFFFFAVDWLVAMLECLLGQLSWPLFCLANEVPIVTEKGTSSKPMGLIRRSLSPTIVVKISTSFYFNFQKQEVVLVI